VGFFNFPCQALSDPDFEESKKIHQMLYLIYATNGALWNLLEITSYAILYHYIFTNNARVESLLKPSVVQHRRRANAISLSGKSLGQDFRHIEMVVYTYRGNMEVTMR